MDNALTDLKQGWQPIVSAPKDGSVIILANEIAVYAGAWSPAVKGDGWPWVLFEDINCHDPAGCCDHEDDERVACNGWTEEAPTHWMPLPTFPGAVA